MATQTTIATFTGAEPLDGDFPYVDLTFGTAYASAAAYQAFPGVAVSDGSGAIVAWIKASSVTASGLRVLVSEQFTGTVAVITSDYS